MGLVSRRKKKKKIDEVGRFAKKKKHSRRFFPVVFGKFFFTRYARAHFMDSLDTSRTDQRIRNGGFFVTLANGFRFLEI